LGKVKEREEGGELTGEIVGFQELRYGLQTDDGDHAYPTKKVGQ